MTRSSARPKLPRPDYRPRGLGVETVADAPAPSKPAPPSRSAARRRFPLIRTLVSLGLVAVLLDIGFRASGVYDRTFDLNAAEHFTLIVRVVVFLVAAYVFCAALMVYRPLAKTLRATMVLALLPATAVGIFTLYGGGVLFGGNRVMLALVNVLVAVCGVIGYLFLTVKLMKTGETPPDPLAERRRSGTGHRARRSRR